jgi:hypothetical protein
MSDQISTTAPSPPHVQKPICSAACQVRSSRSDRESWGIGPVHPPFLSSAFAKVTLRNAVKKTG